MSLEKFERELGSQLTGCCGNYKSYSEDNILGSDDGSNEGSKEGIVDGSNELGLSMMNCFKNNVPIIVTNLHTYITPQVSKVSPSLDFFSSI